MAVDLIQQIKDLQEYYDTNERLKQRLMRQFELAGYSLEHRGEGDEPLVRPKELEELVEEVLKNPPAEPQKYIRISDIPAYISEYLVVLPHDDLERFNNGNRTEHHSVAADVVEEEPEPTMDDKGNVDEYEKTGVVWADPSRIPAKKTFVDSTGTLWLKVANNKFANVQAFDEDAPNYDENYDLKDWTPFHEVIVK